MLENLRDKVWLLVGLLLSIGVTLLPTPQGLTPDGQKMLGLLLFFVIMFVTESLPIGASIFVVIGWLILFGIKTPEEAMLTISHDAGFFIMGALMIANVIVKYDLHLRILNVLLKLSRGKIYYLIPILIAFTAVASGLISDHTVAAILLPVGTAVVIQFGGIQMNPRLGRLIMLSVAYGAAIGAPMTPSGGSRNVIMMAYINDLTSFEVTYADWIMANFPVTLIMIPVATVVLLWLYPPEKKELSQEELKALTRGGVEPMKQDEWVVVITFIIIVASWVTLSADLGIGTVAVLGALLYLALGLADWAEDYQTISWGVVWLYFAAIAFGRNLEDTGAAAWLADHMMAFLQEGLGLASGMGLVIVAVLIMALFTNLISDGPAVALMGPVMLQAAAVAETNPVAVGLATSVASSFAFILIIGTPANAIAYSSGYLEARDFLRAGLVLTVVAILVSLFVFRFWWGIIGFW